MIGARTGATCGLRDKTGGVALLLALCLMATGCALRSRAVEPVGFDWAVVEALQPGALARVDSKWHESIRGRVIAVDAEAIRLTSGTVVGQKERRLERADITRVFSLGDRKTARYAKIGTLIGLGSSVAGIIVPTGVTGGNVRATAWFTAWGAAIGAMAGAGSREQTLIYVQPAARRQ